MTIQLTPIAKACAITLMPRSQIPHVITTEPQLAWFKLEFAGTWYIGARYFVLETPFGETAVHAV